MEFNNIIKNENKNFSQKYFITFIIYQPNTYIFIENLEKEKNDFIEKHNLNYKKVQNLTKRYFSLAENFLKITKLTENYFDKKQFAEIIEFKLLSYNNLYYLLKAYSIKPNHIHFLIDTTNFFENENIKNINMIIDLLKNETKRLINSILEYKIFDWQKKIFYHQIIDIEEENRIIEYILND